MMNKLLSRGRSLNINTIFESSGGVTSGVGANLDQNISNLYDAVAEGNITIFTNGF